MKKHIDTPPRLIHYCIHCAMEHEEKEMNEILAKMFRSERDRLKHKFAHVLEDRVKDSKHKNDFIIDVMREVR